MAYLNFDKTKLINLGYSLKREIISTNQLGAYTSTTIVSCNTRKYHGLLICPIPELDGNRHVLLSDLQETIIQHDSKFNFGMHKYAGDNYEPKGHKYIQDYSSDPIPKTVYQVGGIILTKEIILSENEHRVLIRYSLEQAQYKTIIRFRPFLAFRNIHQLSKANMFVNHKYEEVQNGIVSKLYSDYPALYIQLSKKNEFTPAPDWYYNIEYYEEQKRGYNYKEDLYVPGYFEIELNQGDSVILSAGLTRTNASRLSQKFQHEKTKRIPRNNFENCLKNTAKQFIYNNGKNKFIISGFPWLPVRSRDAIIALPGLSLCLQDQNLLINTIKSLLNQLVGHKIPEQLTESDKQEFAPDTPLWLFWALQQVQKQLPEIDVWKLFGNQMKQIIDGYLNEKDDFIIKKNGLPYVMKSKPHNSWMNASINVNAVVKRYGYIVELGALWYNALCFAYSNKKAINNQKWIHKIEQLIACIDTSFGEVFFSNELGYLADFVANDAPNFQVRPNQIFALSLPFSPLNTVQINSVLDVVKSQLVTELGIRTLSPIDIDYKPKYRGNHQERELAAFNGSARSWLFSHYYDGLKKVNIKSALRDANLFMNCLKTEIRMRGMCMFSEMYNADPPHKAKGAISSALSTGEFMRLRTMIENDSI